MGMTDTSEQGKKSSHAILELEVAIAEPLLSACYIMYFLGLSRIHVLL